jgi:poly(ribitol-phosphate) beta-N-acetylglucosaminyltransferase
VSIKVSVVVAAYNPGEYVEPLLASLVNQSMPADQYEVILVDDGSTDGTAARFDALADAHGNVSAIHIANSGWPGRPRNLGIDAARGEYVYLVDADDFLGAEALERMYEMGRRNGTDIVIGKIVGHGRNTPHTLFAKTHERATLTTAPLVESMTCHKMFRRQFLNEHGIRFPEGKRRLEDHVFVVQAYLLAEAVSVLSDYACYHLVKRDDGGNISRLPFVPADYYGNLREAIAVAEQHSEPGPVRDTVLRRWYRSEMLKRLGGQAFLSFPQDYRRELYDEIHRLALDHFTGPEIPKPYGAPLRARSELLQQGRYDDLVRLAEFEATLSLEARVEEVRWRDGLLRLRLALSVESAGAPVVVLEADGQSRATVAVPGIAGSTGEVAVTPATARVEVFLRHRHSGVERQLQVQSTQPSVAGGGGALSYEAAGSLDPVPGNGPALEEGIWDVHARLSRWGWTPLTRRIGSTRADGVEESLRPALVGPRPAVLVPYWTDHGNLSLDVGQHLHRLTEALQGRCGAPVMQRVAGGATVRIAAPVHVAPGAAPLTVSLRACRPMVADLTVEGQIGAGGPQQTAVLTGRFPSYRVGGQLALSTDDGEGRGGTPLDVALPSRW